MITEVGGMPEVVSDGQTGFLVAPSDPEALASKILFLLENPALSAELGAAGRSRVREHFSRDRMLRDYHAIYQKALAASS